MPRRPATPDRKQRLAFAQDSNTQQRMRFSPLGPLGIRLLTVQTYATREHDLACTLRKVSLRASPGLPPFMALSYTWQETADFSYHEYDTEYLGEGRPHLSDASDGALNPPSMAANAASVFGAPKIFLHRVEITHPPNLPRKYVQRIITSVPRINPGEAMTLHCG